MRRTRYNYYLVFRIRTTKITDSTLLRVVSIILLDAGFVRSHWRYFESRDHSENGASKSAVN